MFFSNVSIAEKYNYLDEKFTCAYKWLAETDIKNLPVGSYPLMGDDVIANVQEYNTAAAEGKRFETHEKYFDVQFLVSGREKFGVAKRDGMKEAERIAEKDLIFYEEPEYSGYVILQEGDMIVVAPEDAHKPGCFIDAPMAVKKVVVKVKI